VYVSVLIAINNTTKALADAPQTNNHHPLSPTTPQQCVIIITTHNERQQSLLVAAYIFTRTYVWIFNMEMYEITIMLDNSHSSV